MPLPPLATDEWGKCRHVAGTMIQTQLAVPVGMAAANLDSVEKLCNFRLRTGFLL